LGTKFNCYSITVFFVFDFITEVIEHNRSISKIDYLLEISVYSMQ